MTWPHITRISYQTMIERSLQRVALVVGAEAFTPKLSFHEHGRAPRHSPEHGRAPRRCSPLRAESEQTPPGSGRVHDAAAVSDERRAGRRSSGRLLLPQITWPAAATTNAFGVDFARLMADMGLRSHASPGAGASGVPPPPPSSSRARGARAGAGSSRRSSPSRARGVKKD